MYAHHPSENWFKYLILFSGATLERIREIASLNGVTPPTLEYLQGLRDSLTVRKPSPFYLRNEATRVWLRKNRLYGLSTNTPEAVEARNILTEDRLRKVLECFLICGTPIEDIAGYVEKAGFRKLSKRVVESYCNYFWNRDLLTAKDWVAFLTPAYPNSVLYLDCYANDTKYTAWKLGVKFEIDAQEVLKGFLLDASMRFTETRSMPNERNTALAAKLWTEIAIGAHTELSKASDATREILEQLKKMAIKLDERKVPSLETLTMIEELGGKSEYTPPEPESDDV